MKYFKDKDNFVYAFESDGSQDEFIKPALIPISEKEALEIVNPAPTHNELVAQAEAKKRGLIVQANQYISSRQWPGKAALGRLKENELAQYNLWLDYLDVLLAVSTASAPDIVWPTPPA